MNQITYRSVSLDRRPYTSMHSRQQSAYKNPREKLQKLKRQSMQAKQYFQTVLSNKIKAQQSLEKAKRQENMIKYNFIKLYQTKRAKKDKINWHEKVKNQSQFSNRSLQEKAKSQKLHSEFDKLIRENQEDERRNYLITQKEEQKKKFIDKLEQQRKKQKRLAKNSHDAIRDAKVSMSTKRMKIQNFTMNSSKWNYVSKMTKQAKLLKQYEVLARQIEQMSQQIGFQENELEILSGQFLITGLSKNL